MKIHVTLCLSDFHVGSGTGIGRTVDSTVLCDENGLPFLPGSSLKGLTRWHAGQLLELPPLAPLHQHAKDLLDELFGGQGKDAGSLFFDDARCQSGYRLQKEVHGRSARDRNSGRAKETALFHVEDAPADEYETDLISNRELRPHAMLLLLMALRRINAVGGQRRRGKGRATVRIHVKEAGEAFQDLKLPEDGESRFASLFDSVLRQPVEASPSTSGEQPYIPAAPAPKSQRTKTIIAYARALQPLALSEDPEADNIIGTMDFISGSSFRGAVAHHLWETVGWDTAGSEFCDTITRERVRFGPLYPCHQRDEHDRPPGPRTLPFPLPHSFLTCKYHPKLLDIKADRERVHGLRDVLWSDPLCRCSRDSCHAPLVPHDGFLQIQSGSYHEVKRIVDARLQRRSIQRTEIDDQTLGSLDGNLYSTEVIPRDTWFAGYLSGDADRIDRLVEVWDAAGLILRVGKSLTRGHGAIRVFLAEPGEGTHPSYPGLLTAAHDPAAGETLGVEPEVDGFTLLLYSDTIAVDRFLRPITHLDEDGCNLWRLLDGDGDSPFTVERGYCSVRRIGGFNGVPGMPRSPDLALTAGSVWRFKWRDGINDADQQSGLDRLRHALQFGVGLRRGEGFGLVLVNFPLLHCRLDQTAARSFGEPELAADTVPPTVQLDAAVGLPIERPKPHELFEPDDVKKHVTKTGRIGLARLLDFASQDDRPAEILWGALQSRLRNSYMRGRPPWEQSDLDKLEKTLKDRSARHWHREDHCQDEDIVLAKLIALFHRSPENQHPNGLAKYRQTLSACSDWLADLSQEKPNG